jgi:thioredoxin reductase (NADPH)
MQKYSTDVVIIGAGPVGLFAVFECGMQGLKCHVIDSLGHVGGQCAALYPEKPIYDIPAYPKISGADLVYQLEAQAKPFDPTYHLSQQVVAFERANQSYRVHTSQGIEIECKGIIIAAGVGAFGPNRPPLEGIELYENKSVFYSVLRKDSLKGLRVVIAGGGDSAIDWALALADICPYIGVVHRREKFRAAPESVARLKSLQEAGKIELVVPYQLDSLNGDGAGHLDQIIVAGFEGERKILKADVLLAFFGLSMNLGPIAEWGLNMDHNHIITNPESAMTSVEGVFAVGDIATYPGKLKLILTGFAEAARAAYSLRQWIFPDEIRHFEYSTTTGVPGSN